MEVPENKCEFCSNKMNIRIEFVEYNNDKFPCNVVYCSNCDHSYIPYEEDLRIYKWLRDKGYTGPL